MSESSHLIIAVDPGKSGGVAHGLSLNTPQLASMPETVVDLRDLFRDILSQYRGQAESVEVWAEKIAGYFSGAQLPQGEGSGGVSPKSMLSFGRVIGHVEAVVACCDLPLREIMPTDWQRKAGIPASKKTLMSQPQWKKYLQNQAKQRYPHLSTKLTLKTCDAALIYYAVHRSLLQPNA